MKKWFAAAALAAVSMGAQAQSQSAFYGLVGGGFTFGGEKLVTVEFDDGSSSDVRSGGLVTFYGGVEYRFDDTFSLQTTIGYHVDSVSAENGSVRFSRYPVELLGHVHVSPSVRIGGGLRKALNPKISGSGFAAGTATEFDSNTGGVIEVEYMFSRYGGVKLRGVFEKYKPTGSGIPANAPEADGNHVGILGTFYF
jgi:hypothetical protein